MNRLLLSVLAVLFFLAPVTMSGAPVPKQTKEDQIKEDLAKLEGTWRVVSYQTDGVERDTGGLANQSELIFSGRDYKWSSGASPGTIEEIDPTQFPKRIAYKYTDGPKKGTIDYGIYMIVGD